MPVLPLPRWWPWTRCRWSPSSGGWTDCAERADEGMVRVERPCRIVVDIAFLMLGAAQRVFDVRAGEFMRRATLLRCGSSRLSFIMLFSWGECGALSPPAAGTPLTEHKVWLSGLACCQLQPCHSPLQALHACRYVFRQLYCQHHGRGRSSRAMRCARHASGRRFLRETMPRHAAHVRNWLFGGSERLLVIGSGIFAWLPWP